MIFGLVIGILLGVASIVFALQNIVVVTLTFFSWQFQGSLALVLLLAVAMGIVISLLIVLPESIANYFRYRTLKKTNERLKDELEKQKELTHFAKKTPPTPEDLARIDEASFSHHPDNAS